jgi:hypothetical protein
MLENIRPSIIQFKNEYLSKLRTLKK